MASDRAPSAAKFARFLHLPAELRLRVYELYLADIDFIPTGGSRTKPPLLLSNRQIRGEALEPLRQRLDDVVTELNHEIGKLDQQYDLLASSEDTDIDRLRSIGCEQSKLMKREFDIVKHIYAIFEEQILGGIVVSPEAMAAAAVAAAAAAAADKDSLFKRMVKAIKRGTGKIGRGVRRLKRKVLDRH